MDTVSTVEKTRQPMVPEMMSQADPLGLIPIPEDTRQRFLRFQVSNYNATFLALVNVTEVLKLTLAEILPIPDVPAWILGVCNWRGEMLWLIDTNILLGAPPLWQQTPNLEAPMVIVVKSADGRTIGLLVEQVDDVELIAPETIVSLNNADTPISVPFVMGHLPDYGGMILDVVSLIEYSLQTLS